MRIRGWLGRADQATKVRGMFVHPQQIQDVMKRHPELAKARLEVTRPSGQDSMRLCCEGSEGPAERRAQIEETLRAFTGLRAEVEFVGEGSLPEDGKLIDDRRAAS